MKYYNARGELDRPHGEAYHGTAGTLFADRIGYEIYPDDKPEGKAPERMHMNTTDATRLHAARFIECVRSRERPEADVEAGHRSTSGSAAGQRLLRHRAKDRLGRGERAVRGGCGGGQEADRGWRGKSGSGRRFPRDLTARRAVRSWGLAFRRYRGYS